MNPSNLFSSKRVQTAALSALTLAALLGTSRLYAQINAPKQGILRIGAVYEPSATTTIKQAVKGACSGGTGFNVEVIWEGFSGKVTPPKTRILVDGLTLDETPLIDFAFAQTEDIPGGGKKVTVPLFAKNSRPMGCQEGGYKSMLVRLDTTSPTNKQAARLVPNAVIFQQSYEATK